MSAPTVVLSELITSCCTPFASIVASLSMTRCEPMEPEPWIVLLLVSLDSTL